MNTTFRFLYLFLFIALLFLLVPASGALGTVSNAPGPVSRALEPVSRALEPVSDRASLSTHTAGPNPQFPDAPDVASYTIDVALDPDTKMLTGSEVITYVNTTDRPIPDLVFHLYLNAFSGLDTLFMQEGGLQHRGIPWDPDHAGWIEVTRIQFADGTPLDLVEIEDGTLARADLPAPIAPGESARVELDFRAQLPRVFARTGYVDDFFMVGQWFPKLGVWERDGWNAYPFHANAEFYADFGTYDVSIALPDMFVTGATGSPVSVDHENGIRTERYLAEGVIDFAWTAAPDFQAATRTVGDVELVYLCLLYTSPSPRDRTRSRMPSSA